MFLNRNYFFTPRNQFIFGVTTFSICTSVYVYKSENKQIKIKKD